MEIRQTLIDIVNDARGWLKVWAQDFTDDEAMQRADRHPGPNPLVWQLGHLAVAQDEVCYLFSGEGRIVPELLKAACATGAPAPGPSTAFLPLPELWSLLERTHARVLQLIERAEVADLKREPIEPNRFFRTLGQSIYELALHETYHTGEISALRKALGKPRIG